MALFSQRKGLRPVQKAIQHESIDEELLNRLWNVLTVSVWNRYSEPVMGRYTRDSASVLNLAQAIWHDLFKLPLDTLPRFKHDIPQSAYSAFRKYFFEVEWSDVYDFIEFVMKSVPANWAQTLREMTNQVLETENSAYRIVLNEVTEISDEHEIASITESLGVHFAAARKHLVRSLELLSDRKLPDYRNSIKESISAIESAGQEVTKKRGATLGDCVKAMEKSKSLHPAFKEGLLKLYGYTSDSGGIRHALTEQTSLPSYDEAKFMLVISSAFINMLAAKQAAP